LLEILRKSKEKYRKFKFLKKKKKKKKKKIKIIKKKKKKGIRRRLWKESFKVNNIILMH